MSPNGSRRMKCIQIPEKQAIIFDQIDTDIESQNNKIKKKEIERKSFIENEGKG